MMVGIMRTPKPSSFWLLLPPALYVFNCLLHWPFFMDDAFIFLRYAQNIATGQGYAFNPRQPIEGTTSLLWTLSAAAGTVLGWGGPLLLKIMGMLAGVAAVLGVALCRPVDSSFFTRIFAACVLATYVPFALLGVSGMETTFAAALLLFAMHHLAARDRADRFTGAVLLSLAFLTRPDLALFFTALPLALLARKDDRAVHRWWLLAVPVATVALATLWRWTSFHDLAPNPARMKAATLDAAQWRAGFSLAGSWLLDQAIIAPAALAAVALARKGTASLWLPLTLFAAYVCALGKPEMGLFYRFHLPAAPLLLALAAGGLTRLEQALGRRALLAGLAALACMPLCWLPAHQRHWREPLERFGLASTAAEYSRAMRGAYPALGRWLDATLPPNATIAILDAGAIPYYARRSTLDLYGLNDRRIADIFRAARRDGDPHAQAGYYRLYVEEILERRPDYFVDTYLPRALVGDPRFRTCYRPVSLPRVFWANERLGTQLRLYRRTCP